MMSRSSVAGPMIRGAVAGLIATWAMDVMTTRLRIRQSGADARREKRARPNGQSPSQNLVDSATAAAGLALNPRQRELAATVTHYALGMVPGAAYAALRPRLPLLGLGRGLVFGTLLWAINDELLNTMLGAAGPPEAYPASSHMRGLAGHLTLGVVTDIGVDLLGAL